MSNIWLKICGITTNVDALRAAELGVEAIGLNFYPASPRAISTDQIDEILSGMPSQTEVVALFVDPEREEVERVLESGRIDYLQFHGSESASFCESFGVPYLKAFHVKEGEDLLSSIGNYGSAELILLDSFDRNVRGGTGKTFDWDRAIEVREQIPDRLVLAGGLGPDNARRAVQEVSPRGLDVSSGVEISPGIKDHEKMKSFVEEARSV